MYFTVHFSINTDRTVEGQEPLELEPARQEGEGFPLKYLGLILLAVESEHVVLAFSLCSTSPRDPWLRLLDRLSRPFQGPDLAAPLRFAVAHEADTLFHRQERGLDSPDQNPRGHEPHLLRGRHVAGDSAPADHRIGVDVAVYDRMLPHDQRCTWRLEVIGEGELAEELVTEAIALGIRDQVWFRGFRSDVHNIVASADLVVLPSLWEGLSVSLLEAMALGKPTITTTIPSNCEVVYDTGCAVLVPPANAAALAREISALMASSARRTALGLRARSRYQQAYGVQRMQDRYLELYAAVIN